MKKNDELTPFIITVGFTLFFTAMIWSFIKLFG